MGDLGGVEGDGFGAKQEVGLELLEAGLAGVAGGFWGHKWLPSIAE